MELKTDENRAYSELGLDWETLGTINPAWNLKFRDQSRRKLGKDSSDCSDCRRPPVNESQFNTTLHQHGLRPNLPTPNLHQRLLRLQ